MVNSAATSPAPSQSAGEGYPDYELVFEWNYKIQLTKFAFVQPDLQWVINPGGTNRIPNAPRPWRPDGRHLLNVNATLRIPPRPIMKPTQWIDDRRRLDRPKSADE